MKKILFCLFILWNVTGFGQELELSGGINTTFFNNASFYKGSSVFLQPGIDAGIDMALNPLKTLFSGMNVSYYRSGLLYKSDAGIKHLLKRQIWVIKLPFYYRYSMEKFDLKSGIIFQYPISDIYVYDIYDGNNRVYHNSDKPIQHPYKDYMQFLLGAGYHLSKRLKLNFQISALVHFHISTGLIYSLNLNTKHRE